MRRLPYIRGASWLELAVVLLVFSVIAAMLANRLLYYEEVAEKTGVEYVATILRSALKERMGELIIQNREVDIPGLVDQNPFAWLEKPPSSYCGEVELEPGPEMQTGCWYFIRKDRQLTYLVRNGANFLPDSLGRKRIRYRLSVLRKNGMVTPSAELRLVEQYRWFG